jgi:Zn-dependent peptidase ImmA (M78 family)
VLLNAGIYVFKNSFSVEGYFGFSLFDDEFPIIYVNNSSAKTRQIFTLFHELAHPMFYTSGVDGLAEPIVAAMPRDAGTIEVWCNRFASAFLVPEHALDLAIQSTQPDEALAEGLANRFNVSREVIFRRSMDRGLVSHGEYEEAVARWNAQRLARGSGGDWYWTQLSYLGRDYVSLAFRQFHQNRITETQLCEYLETKPKNLSTLES